LFAYNDSEPFDADKHFKRFKKYDSWDYKEYKEFLQDRYVTFLVCNMCLDVDVFCMELICITLLLIRDSKC